MKARVAKKVYRTWRRLWELEERLDRHTRRVHEAPFLQGFLDAIGEVHAGPEWGEGPRAPVAPPALRLSGWDRWVLRRAKAGRRAVTKPRMARAYRALSEADRLAWAADLAFVRAKRDFAQKSPAEQIRAATDALLRWPAIVASVTDEAFGEASP